MLWRHGGLAFSPGQLSAKSKTGIALDGFVSHADFEEQCQYCHLPLETSQDVLCLSCHKDVSGQIEQALGTHGRIDNVNQCATCHSDHQGRDFNPSLPALALFDHNRTAFDLTWHQVDFNATPLQCSECHDLNGDFSSRGERCTACHARQDSTYMQQHFQDFGNACMTCHDGQDQMVNFDHRKTDFPLIGAHSGLGCAECHGLRGKAVEQANLTGIKRASTHSTNALSPTGFKETPTSCIGCHGEPRSHQGMFDADCEHCHNPAAWLPANLDGKVFRHDKTTRFSLERHAVDYAGQALACADCHTTGVDQFDLQVCVTCHTNDPEQPKFMADHLAQFGSPCLDCHDGVDRLSNFDHANRFPLDGAHAPLGCETCHAEKVFRGTPSECWQCHQEPAIHQGFFGLKCEYCHSSLVWKPASLHLHNFPLQHGLDDQSSSCQTCHPAAYSQYTCYGCHDHQPEAIQISHLQAGISIEELPECFRCHPGGKKEAR
jgi:hypothetical protein